MRALPNTLTPQPIPFSVSAAVCNSAIIPGICCAAGVRTTLLFDMKKTLLLVDGSSYLYRAYHAMPDLRNAKGEPTGDDRKSVGEGKSVSVRVSSGGRRKRKKK